MNNSITTSKPLPRMRTIRQAAHELSFPEYALRRLVKQNKVVYVMAGNKALVNMDRLIDYLNSGEMASL